MRTVQHGTVNEYTNQGCRCQPCKTAHAASVLAAKKRRARELITKDGRPFHPRVPHGRASSYGNWGCRCRPCTDAHTKDVTDRAKAKANA